MEIPNQAVINTSVILCSNQKSQNSEQVFRTGIDNNISYVRTFIFVILLSHTYIGAYPKGNAVFAWNFEITKVFV